MVNGYWLCLQRWVIIMNYVVSDGSDLYDFVSENWFCCL